MSAITWGLGCPDPKPQKPLYIKPQPTIYLYDPLELLEGIIEADKSGTDTVYILNPGKGNGRTGIDLWYAKAVYERIK